MALGKSVNALMLVKSRESDAFEPSSSELSEEVPLLALSDLPRAPLLSALEASFDDSGSVPVPPDDCCLRLRYSDMDNWKNTLMLPYNKAAFRHEKNLNSHTKIKTKRNYVIIDCNDEDNDNKNDETVGHTILSATKKRYYNPTLLTLRLTGGGASDLKAGAGILFGTTVLGSFNRFISLGLVSSSLAGVSSGFGAS